MQQQNRTDQQEDKPCQSEHERREHIPDRKDFQREDDLFNVAGIADDQPGAGVHAFGEYVKHRHTAKHDHGERRIVVAESSPPPTGFEHNAEDEGVDGEHHQWMGKTPDQSQHRSPIPAGYVAFENLHQQITMLREDTNAQKRIEQF